MLAVEANYFKARSLQKLATLAIKKDKKVVQIIKISPKWVPKSIRNLWKSRLRRGCVFGAFWGSPGARRNAPRPSLLGAIFVIKSKKGAKRSPKGPQSLKKRHLKIDVKNCIERWRKNMPKGSQNDANIYPKVIDFSCFFDKGENARNHCIYKLKRGSGHVKSNEKSV